MKIKDHHWFDCVPEEFHDLEVIFDDSWSTYEEHGFVVVFDFFGEMFEWSYESSVFAEDNTIYFEPQLITDDQLIDLKKYWKDQKQYSYEEML